jgi:hypothetical protein
LCVSVVRLPVCIRLSVSVCLRRVRSPVCVRLSLSCAFASLSRSRSPVPAFASLSRSRVRLCLRLPLCLGRAFACVRSLLGLVLGLVLGLCRVRLCAFALGRCRAFVFACVRLSPFWARLAFVVSSSCLRASTPSRLRAFVPPRLRASAPPRLRAFVPPRLRAFVPLRLRASVPSPSCLCAFASVPLCLCAFVLPRASVACPPSLASLPLALASSPPVLSPVCSSPCLLFLACAPLLFVPLRLRFSLRPAAVRLRRSSPIIRPLRTWCWIWNFETGFSDWLFGTFFFYLFYVYNNFFVSRGSEDLAS